MPRARRLPLMAAVVATLALAFTAACGVDGGDRAATSAASTTTRPAPADGPATTSSTPDRSTTTADRGATTTTEADSTGPQDPHELLVEVYTEMGFTEDEASCLADHLAGSSGIDPSDPSALMDLINECDIPLSRLTELNQDLGNGDPTETMRKSLAAGLRAAGLTADQADCVASAYVDEYGTDPSKANDVTALRGLFLRCDVDPNSAGG